MAGPIVSDHIAGGASRAPSLPDGQGWARWLLLMVAAAIAAFGIAFAAGVLTETGSTRTARLVRSTGSAKADQVKILGVAPTAAVPALTTAPKPRARRDNATAAPSAPVVAPASTTQPVNPVNTPTVPGPIVHTTPVAPSPGSSSGSSAGGGSGPKPSGRSVGGASTSTPGTGTSSGGDPGSTSAGGTGTVAGGG